MDHDIQRLTALPSDARFYVRPTAFVNGPLDQPGSAVQLAGGLTWFAKVQIMARADGPRLFSALVDVAEMPGLAAAHPGLRDSWTHLTSPRRPLPLGGAPLRLDRPHLIGILNVTPDSFSDGGAWLDPTDAIRHAQAMITAGAAVIDVGAESTRPGAKALSAVEEQARLDPVLAPLCALGTPVSLDTRNSAVMACALQSGVAIINDISALTGDPASVSVVAGAGCPVVLMHMQGEPGSMLDNPHYSDVLLDVYDYLAARIDACLAAGIDRDRIVIDPGIGFGKRLRHNLDLVNGLSLFHALGCPVLLGASRKRLIGALSAEEPADARLPGSLALAAAGLAQGVQLLRVHDVAAHLQMLRVWQGLRDAALTPPLQS